MIPGGMEKIAPWIGWLSPQGQFFSCEFGGHTAWADQELRMTRIVAEKLGWVPLSAFSNEILPFVHDWSLLSDAQVRWMNEEIPHGLLFPAIQELVRIGADRRGLSIPDRGSNPVLALVE